MMFERGLPTGPVEAEQAWLTEQAVPRGGVVAWLGPNRWQMLALLAACEAHGAVLLPLNWRLAVPELRQILEHAQACALRFDEEMAAVAQQLLLPPPARGRAGEGVETRHPAASQPPSQPSPCEGEGVRDGDLLLVYTSGTTGAPKGALHTRAGMAANLQAAVAAQGLDATTRTLAVLPLFHMGGLCIQVLPTLAVGGTLLLQPRFDPAAWFDAVEQQRPTTSLLVPAVMRALIDHPRWPRADLSSLRFVTAGSQIVPLHLIEAFHARGVPVAQVYGATETGPVSLVIEPARARELAGTAGVPALGVQVRLGANGEIWLRAPNLMRGYHRSRESAFDAEGWFATGDLAVARPGGVFEVVGRSKELIISGGENIHPAEIEHLVAAMPGVADCAVVGLPDERWGEVPVLAVVLQPGSVIDEAAVVQHLSERLARFKLPRRVLVLPALPKTALGKVQRGEVAALLSSSGQFRR